MENVLISIIIPIYNSEKNLYRCIDSLIKQSVKEIEIILIDDGSIDKSLSICNEIANQDSRVKVFSQRNSGVSVARNRGINMAKGKYIMFCDSDDFVEENWCKELLNIIYENEKIFAVCGRAIINNRAGQKIINKQLFDKEFSISKLNKEDFFKLYKKYLINSPCNKIYVTKIINDNNIRFNEELSLGEDLLFNLEYMRYINEIKIVNKALYNYIRTDEESLDNKYYENLFEIYKYLNSELYRYMKEFKVDLKEEEKDFYSSYFYMLMKVLNNTFNKKCSLTFFNKIKYNSYILKSREFKLCLEKSNSNSILNNDMYIKLLKSEKYILVYIFSKLSFVKNKVLNFHKIKFI